MAEISYLSHARYGKDKVRVLRVVREGAWHNIVEYNVTALVEGEIETRSVMFFLTDDSGGNAQFRSVTPRRTTPSSSPRIPVRTSLHPYITHSIDHVVSYS